MHCSLTAMVGKPCPTGVARFLSKGFSAWIAETDGHAGPVTSTLLKLVFREDDDVS